MADWTNRPTVPGLYIEQPRRWARLALRAVGRGWRSRFVRIVKKPLYGCRLAIGAADGGRLTDMGARERLFFEYQQTTARPSR